MHARIDNRILKKRNLTGHLELKYAKQYNIAAHNDLRLSFWRVLNHKLGVRFPGGQQILRRPSEQVKGE